MTPSPAQVHRLRTLFDEPCVKTVMHLATRYMTSSPKSKPMSKSLVLNQTKSLLLKLKNDNDYGAKRKNERVYTKSNKTPRLNVFNNNNEKHKLLRRNVPFKNQVEPSPTAIANGAIKRKPFEKKSKRGTTNRMCNVKLHKLLHKLVKLHLNLKFNKSKLIMDFLHDKSDTKWNKCFKTILHHQFHDAHRRV